MIKEVTLSVCVQTYQQVSYIKKCLDSILMQKVNFTFEIILGEDESNDGTREICIEYANKYPDIIRLFLRRRKDVIYVNNKATGRYNFIENLSMCLGRYIAILEGDDYWTDENKLQKQVDFLEQNQEFSICFHKILIQEKDRLYPNAKWFKSPSQISTFEDLAVLGNYIPTCSVVLKNFHFRLPEFIKECVMGDYPLFLLTAERGKIFEMNETMAVYRIKSGSFSNKSIFEKLKSLYDCVMLLQVYYKKQDSNKLVHFEVLQKSLLIKIIKEAINMNKKEEEIFKYMRQFDSSYPSMFMAFHDYKVKRDLKEIVKSVGYFKILKACTKNFLDGMKIIKKEV